MRKVLFLILAAAIASISCTKAEVESAKTQYKATVVSSGIKFSEGSVIYKDAVLVSNFGTAELDPMNSQGLGYISKIKGSESQIFINTDGHLSAPKGMAISGSYLLIADVGKVVIYNLDKTSQAPRTIALPAGNLFVNDIVIMDKMAYVSVTNTGKIFKLDISDIDYASSAQLSEYASVVGANGLVIDANMIYVASYPADGVTTADNVIYVIEDIANPKPKKLIMREGQYDGIALSGTKLYFSDWVKGQIGYVDLKTKMVSIITIENATITGPADISIFMNKLYIPNLPSSEVVVVDL